MPDRPPEFSDIDLDEEDEEEKPKPDSDEEALDPIGVDDAEDEDLDLEDDDENDDDVDADVEGGPPRASVASPDPLDEEENEADLDIARDGIQRAAAVLKYIVENIVDEPDQISIGATSDDRGPVLLLSVAEDDRGKVIGRQGRIVQAIRTVVKAATVGTGERVSVEIID